MKKLELMDQMNVVAAETQRLIRSSRASGLSNEAAVLAALIGALSVIRVDGLNEDALLSEARLAVPHRMPGDGIMQVSPH